MKLLLCKKCQDVIRLMGHWRWCECGRCAGRYLADGRHAVYTGGPFAAPLGIDNSSLKRALRARPHIFREYGIPFEAFAVPGDCKTYRPAKSTPPKPRDPNVNVRVWAILSDDPAAWKWTSEEFARRLGCTGQAVRKTAAWRTTRLRKQQIQVAKREKAERFSGFETRHN